VTFSQCDIPGCYQIQLPVHSDARGNFVKTIASSQLAGLSLETEFVETFYTVSGENVLRGMHLQLPPADHAKFVYCVAGAVMDVCLDVRRGSPEFGRHIVVELSAERHNALYLPRGVAHGFYVRQAPAIIVYHVTSEHEPTLDSGIAWNSFGAKWPTDSPLLSSRDAALTRFQDFASPFCFSGRFSSRLSSQADTVGAGLK
jgi:dTDP-4-dehydrorhamnose 3,5-epimerase